MAGFEFVLLTFFTLQGFKSGSSCFLVVVAWVMGQSSMSVNCRLMLTRALYPVNYTRLILSGLGLLGVERELGN